jgi:hypothetical protein
MYASLDWLTYNATGPRLVRGHKNAFGKEIGAVPPVAAGGTFRHRNAALALSKSFVLLPNMCRRLSSRLGLPDSSVPPSGAPTAVRYRTAGICRATQTALREKKRERAK